MSAFAKPLTQNFTLTRLTISIGLDGAAVQISEEAFEAHGLVANALSMIIGHSKWTELSIIVASPTMNCAVISRNARVSFVSRNLPCIVDPKNGSCPRTISRRAIT